VGWCLLWVWLELSGGGGWVVLARRSWGVGGLFVVGVVLCAGWRGSWGGGSGLVVGGGVESWGCLFGVGLVLVVVVGVLFCWGGGLSGERRGRLHGRVGGKEQGKLLNRVVEGNFPVSGVASQSRIRGKGQCAEK